MLDIAKKHEKEFQEKYIETWYDLQYQYYRDSSGDRIPQLADNCYDRRDFVSLNDDGEVIGFISYFFNDVNSTASQFGIISFDIGNREFAKDVLQVIADIFFKFHLDRIEFWCFDDNPATNGYRAFIKRFGGREVGHLRRSCKLMDGNFHDSVIFEILREDLRMRLMTPITFSCNVAIPELAYQTAYREDEFVEENLSIEEVIDMGESKWINIPQEFWDNVRKQEEEREARRPRKRRVIYGGTTE